MNKKGGFTLIELLAVIVILAIIAVIAVPIVLNIISESKDNATLRSAEMYAKAAELSIAQSTLKDKSITDGTYNIKDGDICLNDACTDKLEVEVNGETPKSGTITITNGEILGVNIILGGKEITKNSKGELVYIKKLNEVCKSVKDQKYATNPYDEGYKYECKVDPNKDPYTFYVLNTRNKAGEIITESLTDKEAVSINLIMAQNINSDGTPTTKAILETDKAANGGIYNLVEWVSKVDYNDDDNYGTIGNNNKGPLTAMNFLSEATKNWTNTNKITTNKYTECDWTAQCIEKNMIEYTLNARLPYNSEVNNVGCNDEEISCPVWMVDYLHDIGPDYAITYQENPIDGILGYWTLSSWAGDSRLTLHVACYGASSNGYNPNKATYMGVRPVINLKI